MPKRKAARGRGRGGKSTTSLKKKKEESNTCVIPSDEKEDESPGGLKGIQETSEDQLVDNDKAKTVEKLLEKTMVVKNESVEAEKSNVIIEPEEKADVDKDIQATFVESSDSVMSLKHSASDDISVPESLENKEIKADVGKDTQAAFVESSDSVMSPKHSAPDDTSVPESLENKEIKVDVGKDTQAAFVESSDSVMSPKHSASDDTSVPESLENKEIKSSNITYHSISTESDPPQTLTEADGLSEQVKSEKQNNDIVNEEPQVESHNDNVDEKVSSGLVEEVEEMFVDKEVDDDIQYIDEEIEEVDEEGDQDLVDVMEMGDKDNVKAIHEKDMKTSFQRSLSFSKQGPNSKQAKDDKGDLADTTFEEISEGSMDPMEQEEAIIEAISDNEMILEPSSQEADNEKETSREGNVSPPLINEEEEEDETLADIFEVTANDDYNIAAQDNDDISDTSLCAIEEDEDKNNLSLEEISDDELESSKRKKLEESSQPLNTEDQEKEKSPEDDATVIVSDSTLDESFADPKIDEEKSVHSNREEDVSQAENVSDTGVKEKDNDSCVKENIVDSSVKEDVPDSGVQENTFESDGTAQQSKDVPEKTTLCLTTDSENEKTQQQKATPLTKVTEETSAKSSKNTLATVKLTPKPVTTQTTAPSEQVLRPITKITDASIQTQPVGKRGKIVQCHINRIGGGISQLVNETKKEEPNDKVTDDKDHMSEIFNKYKNHLPSSVEDIFTDVAFTHVPNEGTYSLSLGPVMAADFGNDKFRDICFNSAENLNITFKSKLQGVLQAQFVKHKEVSSVIHNLKCLDLGIRYMILSLKYRTAEKGSRQIWHAVLIFTYNQDEPEMKAWGDTKDGKVRSRLAVTGVPDTISKDFVQLLFPEALYISTGLSVENGRALTLGLSSTKTAKDISSCYELLLFNGEKVEITSMDAVISETVEDAIAPGFIEEDGTVIVEEDIDEVEETRAVGNEDAIEEVMNTMDSNPAEDDKSHEEDRQTSGEEMDIDALNTEKTSDENSKDSSDAKDESLNKDSEKKTDSESGHMKNGNKEDKAVDENISESTGKDGEMEEKGEKTTEGTVNEKEMSPEEMEVEVAGKEKSGVVEERPQELKVNDSGVTVASDKTEDSQGTSGDGAKGILQPGGEKSAERETVPGEVEKASSETIEEANSEITLETSAAKDSTENLERTLETSAAKDSTEDLERTLETAAKDSTENLERTLETSAVKDSTEDSERTLETSAAKDSTEDSERTLETSAAKDSTEDSEKTLETSAVKDSTEVSEKTLESTAAKDSTTKIQEASLEKEKSDGGDDGEGKGQYAENEQEHDDNKILEDVSDDEMVGTELTKAVEFDNDDDVIILKEEPSKKVVANIDLTADDHESPTKPDSTNDNIEIKKEIKIEDLIDDDKLSMRDGDFEIHLESIDVEEEETDHKSVLESREYFGNYRGKYYNNALIRDLTMACHPHLKWTSTLVQDIPPKQQQHSKHQQYKPQQPIQQQYKPSQPIQQQYKPQQPVQQQQKQQQYKPQQPIQQQNTGNKPMAMSHVRENSYVRREPQPPMRGQPSEIREQVSPDTNYDRSYGRPGSEVRSETRRNYEKISSIHSGSSLEDNYGDVKSTKRRPVPAMEQTSSRRDSRKRDYPRSQSPSPRRDISERLGDPATSYHHSNKSFSGSTAKQQQQHYSNYSSNTSRSYSKNYIREHRAPDSPPPGRSSHHHQQPPPSSSSYYDFKGTRPSDEYSSASRSRQGNNSKYESSSSWRDNYRSQKQPPAASALTTRHGEKSRSFSPLSVSSTELLSSPPPAKKSRRISHSPISASSRSLSPISKSPSPLRRVFCTSDKHTSDKYKISPPKAYRDREKDKYSTRDKYSPISTRDLDVGRLSSGHRRSRSRSPYKNWERERGSRRSRSPQYRRRSPSPGRERVHQGQDKKTTSSGYRSSHVESSRPAESSRPRATVQDIASGISKYESLIKALYDNKKKASAGRASLLSNTTKQKHSDVDGGSNTTKANKSSYNQSSSAYKQTSSSLSSAPGYKSGPSSSSNKNTSSSHQQHQHQNYPPPTQSANPVTTGNYTSQPSMYYPTNAPGMYNQYNMGTVPAAGGMNPAAFQAYSQQQQAMNNAMMYSYMQSASASVTMSSNPNNPYATYSNAAQQQMMQRQQQQLAFSANMRGGTSMTPSSMNPTNSAGKVSSSSKPSSYQSQGDDKPKQWSMGEGANALLFQRILSSSGKGKK